MDHLGINDTFLELNAAWMHDTEGLSEYCHAFSEAMQVAGEAMFTQMRNTAGGVPGNGDGTRAILSLVDSLAFSSRHFHQVLSKWLTEYVLRAPDLHMDTRRRALFWIRQILEMLAPANYFWTNPRAVRRLVDSHSESLLQGITNWLNDVQRGDCLPELTDHTAFKVGESLAVTPGAVVYRNPLLEVIQYAPQTAHAWPVPIVMIQPWINKYYIFDLTPQSSFVRFLVRQGFTVFVTSWKNPTCEMAHFTFEDYMFHGALKAVHVAREICGCAQVHAAGYCIGGTLLAALLGWLAHETDRQPIIDATFFATLLDFAEPGDLKVFVNQASLNAVEQLVASDGVLKSRHMALAFRMLNSGDLIWRNMVTNYFYGQTPPRSDMLFWNNDSTSLPGAMCLFYLKAFYAENRMAHPGRLVLGHRPIDLKRVRLPLYAVGAEKDHICPWPATFQTCRLTASPVRYVLSSEGHITGIVSPPAPWSKKKYWAGTASRRRDEKRWLLAQTPQTGSWWPDWVNWLQHRSGAQGAPPSMGSERFKPLEPAPGSYVHERS